MITVAQTNDWRVYIEQMAEDLTDESSMSNLYDELLFLEENPMNLNTVSVEELLNFPLLSPEQALGVADFLKFNGKVFSVYELRNVSVLDYNTIERVLPFFYIGDEVPKLKPSLGEMLRYGHHDIQVRFDKTLEQRAGYGEFTDSVLLKYPNRKYLGEDFYTSARYSFSYKDKLEFGVLGEKDAGEPFLMNGQKKGFDHYGAHFALRDVGFLKTLVLGNYRLSFGQGLVVNNNFGVPKAWAAGNLIMRTREPRKHASMAESGYFRGVAATVGRGSLTATGFFSEQPIDANVSDAGEITSFKTDGYHRVPLDMTKINNSREMVTGGNVNFKTERFQIGANGIYHVYNRKYNPLMRDYNAHYLRGRDNANFSVDYSVRVGRINVGGETAMSLNGAVATVNAIEYIPDWPYIGALSLLYRDYPIDYQAIHAKAFSDGNINNERGLFFSSAFYPFSRMTLMVYADLVHHPWVRYNVDAPSSALDFQVNAVYALSKSSSLEMRYTLKEKEKNMKPYEDDVNYVLPYMTHKLRTRYLSSTVNGWEFKSTADLALYQVQFFPMEKGVMLSQNIGYRGNSPWRGDVFVGVFKADSYYARLYSYERNIMNTFYMPSFYGEGARLALSGRYELGRHLSISLKFGHTRYFDRNVISSGTEQINGNSRTDLFTYLHWKI